VGRPSVHLRNLRIGPFQYLKIDFILFGERPGATVQQVFNQEGGPVAAPARAPVRISGRTGRRPRARPGNRLFPVRNWFFNRCFRLLLSFVAMVCRPRACKIQVI
jgi:hypothetical protein